MIGTLTGSAEEFAREREAEDMKDRDDALGSTLLEWGARLSGLVAVELPGGVDEENRLDEPLDSLLVATESSEDEAAFEPDWLEAPGGGV